MRNKKDLEKLNFVFDNLAEEAINNDIDKCLVEEKIDPEQLVFDGLSRIKKMQKNLDDTRRKEILNKITEKINSIKNNVSKSTIEAINNFLPNLTQPQLLAVYRSLDDDADDETDDDLIEMKNEILLRNLTKKFGGNDKNL